MEQVKISLSDAKKIVKIGEWWKLADWNNSTKRKSRLGSKKWRITHLYKILNKDGKTVVFKPNAVQWVLFHDYEQLLKTGEGIRYRILKARQMGCTTFHCIYYTDDIIWTPGLTAAIIAHKKEPLEKIFEIVKRAYEKICLPEALKPKADTENVRELSFKELDSRIYVSLAVRSGTVHRLHVSERAYIPDPIELKTGSYQSVPVNGVITEETTAKDMGEFYQAWDKGTGWSKRFLSWLLHEEYQLDNAPNFWFPEHDKYLEEIGATEKQKNWWMKKYAELDADIKSDELIEGIDLMKREYPACAEEAFVSNSNTVFKNYDWIIEKPCRKIDVQSLQSGWLEINTKSNLTLWKEAVPGVGYSMGVDVSEGLAKGDYSCIYVLNNQLLRVEAVWHGRIDPDVLAKIVFVLGIYYNEAYIGVERNNHGITVIDHLKHEYQHLYRQRVYEGRIDKQTEKIGWVTTLKTKPLMINDLKKLIRDEELEIHDAEIKKEFNTYVSDDAGRTNALSGNYDDRIMALAIAYQVYKKHPGSPVDKSPERSLHEMAISFPGKTRSGLG